MGASGLGFHQLPEPGAEVGVAVGDGRALMVKLRRKSRRLTSELVSKS